MSQGIISPGSDMDALTTLPSVTLGFPARHTGRYEGYTFIDQLHEIIFLAAPVCDHDLQILTHPLMSSDKGVVKLLFSE